MMEDAKGGEKKKKIYAHGGRGRAGGQILILKTGTKCKVDTEATL
jgi:hypothetical protein